MDDPGGAGMLYVRMVDGTSCFAPLPAKQNPDGTFHMLDNDEFHPDDASTVLEFIPGDDVEVAVRTFDREGRRDFLAIKLVRSSAPDRDYCAVLFYVSEGEAVPDIGDIRLNDVATRVREETTTGQR